jgi:hypothetical protein
VFLAGVEGFKKLKIFGGNLAFFLDALLMKRVVELENSYR